MTFDDLLADFDKLYGNSVYMYGLHLKTCETCKSGVICDEMVKLDDLVEQIEPIHYKYAETGKCRCK